MQAFRPSGEGLGLGIRLGGIPVRVDVSFFIIVALLGYGLGDLTDIAIWVGVVLVSILVHELGHAVAMRLSGVDARVILYAMGGVTIPSAAIQGRGKRIAVDLAGAGTAFTLLGIPAIYLYRTWTPPSAEWDLVVWTFVWVNVAWSVVNLLPILPLDGGNVTKEVLDAVTRERGEVPARVVSIVVAGALGLYAVTSGWLFGGLFALFFVAINYRALADRQKQASLVRAREAYRALERGDVSGAAAAAQDVLNQRADLQVRGVAAEILAWAHLMRGDDDAARHAFHYVPAEQEGSGHLRALLTEPDPAERVNATVDAWLEGSMVPPPVYVERLARDGLLDRVAERLAASRADGADEARQRFRALRTRAGA